jgi:hypothetical protein
MKLGLQSFQVALRTSRSASEARLAPAAAVGHHRKRQQPPAHGLWAPPTGESICSAFWTKIGR